MTDWSFDAWPAIEPKWHDGAALAEYDRLEFHVDLGCGTIKKGRIGIDRYPAPGVNVVMDLDKGRVAAMAPAPGRDAVDPLPTGAFRYHYPNRPPGSDFYAEQPSWLDYPTMPEFAPRGDGYHYAAGTVEAYTIANGLPFETASIESIISHHCLEHIGAGFIPLIDEVYRVLKPGGIFRAITPLFPSSTAVSDADHCRYFMEDTWLAFCGHLGDENNPTGSWLDSFSVPYTKARFNMLDLDMTPRVEPEKHWTGEDAREIRVALEAVK